MEDIADQISDHAREFRNWATNPDRFLESCDGGDPGTPANPSIWVMGIEPGWSLADQEKEANGQTISPETLAEYSIDLQLGWRFNASAFKLLAALDGQSPEDYAAFAKDKRPFERGCTGYFKGNLFPEAFHNVPAWDDEAAQATGFSTKAEYQVWMKAARFPILTSWIEKCRPKLIIGLGLTHADDFLAVVQASKQPEQHSFEVNGHWKRMLMSRSGLVPLAILPHLTGGPNGLNSNEAIAQAAQQIRSHLRIDS
jgi:hypothetical protein